MKSNIQAKDLRGNGPEELIRTLKKLEEDLFQYRLKKNTNQLENTMLVRTARRDIARIKTVLSERMATTSAISAPATPAKEK